jgi:RNA polymerase sigma factor (sigma-70 family)
VTTEAAIEAVWRIESGRLIATLARITRDFSTAEDLAQDAFEVALKQWPRDGIPENPGAWLTGTAKHLAVDRHRRRLTLERKLETLAIEDASRPEGVDPMAAIDEDIDAGVEDDMLRLIFTACHPVLTPESQVALVLRTLGGLQTREIARAFLVPEATIGQRISRAKKTLSDHEVRFELPDAAERSARLTAVLGVVYFIFNEGYSASTGDDWTRPALCNDALRLGRVLAGLRPDEPEVHGLLALMELQASRIPARTTDGGEPVLLGDQDRRRWDQLLIRRGLAALERAEELGGGAYTLQAAIAACHARSRSVEETDWRRIVALYTVLSHLAPSPVVSLNRAVAVGMAEGPTYGLELTDLLADDPSLATYPQLPAVRATFLERLGRREEAQREFERAAALTQNASERRLYLSRASALVGSGSSSPA